MANDQSRTIEKVTAMMGKASLEGAASFNRGGATNNVSEYISANASLIVRPEYNRNNYENARPNEKIPRDFIDVLLFCNESYYTVSIVRNVIDLMSDFCVKGIDWAHPNRNVQAFMRNWFAMVNGQDVSERFCNYLLRLGSNCILPEYSKIDETTAQEWRRSRGSEFKLINPQKLVIPSNYSFIDVTALTEEITSSTNLAANRVYKVNTGGGLISSFSSYSSTLRFQSDFSFSTKLFQSLPTELKDKALKNKGLLYVEDNKDVFIHHYKKDDWDSWSRPLIYAIAEPIIMLKKMHLADMSALDGVISSVRLWRIGYIDPTNVLNSIIPTAPMLTKVQQLIQNNIAGGVLDIVWGPDLDFKESSSNSHQFLNQQKYYQVMSEIYEGLGINPSISGGNSGGNTGMTNNSIALKVMVERLTYLRNKLTKFWSHQAKLIQKAMGFSSPAQIVYDDAVFSDEVTYKKLLIELFDRDIISGESIRDEFNFINSIESSRILKEYKRREKNTIPPKAGPYHDPMIKDNLKKDLIKSGQVDGEELGIEDVSPPEPKFSKDSGGRPIGAKDTTKRAEKKVSPKSFVKLNAWARESFDKVGEIIGQQYLTSKGKSNFRQLTNEETNEFEDIKLSILLSVDPFCTISVATISESAENIRNCKAEIAIRDTLLKEFEAQKIRQITMDDKRIAAAGAYCISKMSEI